MLKFFQINILNSTIIKGLVVLWFIPWFCLSLYLVINIVEIGADILVLIAEFPQGKYFPPLKMEKFTWPKCLTMFLRFKSAPYTRHLWIENPQLKHKAIETICG